MSGQDTSEASQKIDARIDELGDWRGDVLARIRALIKAAEQVGKNGSGVACRCGTATE